LSQIGAANDPYSTNTLWITVSKFLDNIASERMRHQPDVIGPKLIYNSQQIIGENGDVKLPFRQI